MTSDPDFRFRKKTPPNGGVAWNQKGIEGGSGKPAFDPVFGQRL